jgi:hypothetical protein
MNLDVPGRYLIDVSTADPNEPVAASVELTRSTALPLVVKLKRWH